MTFRTGLGVDVHPLVTGRDLILGGVKVQSEFGIEGHSDGDILSHSLIDAFLGAAGLGDIGSHYPSSNPEYKDISSLLMLRESRALCREKGFRIVNTDSTIILQSPKLSSYIPSIKTSLANVLECDEDVISVKATTTDHLGFVGNGEGIAALTTVLISRVE